MAPNVPAIKVNRAVMMMKRFMWLSSGDAGDWQLPAGRQLVTRIVTPTMAPADRGRILHMDEAAKDRVVARDRFAMLEGSHIDARRGPARREQRLILLPDQRIGYEQN